MIYTSRFACLCFFLVFWLNLLSSQNITPNLKNDLDAILENAYAADGPGVAVLVAHQDHIIYQGARGMADLEMNVALRTDHIFRIGSVTKQFTAAAILRLAEQGKLDVQDDITRFIPDYPSKGKHITIEQLLTHTSGIRSYTEMPEWDKMTHRKDFTAAELVDFFKDQPLDFEPGTKWKYNNSGYVLLGFIIEKITGKAYGDYIEEQFFKPLNMKDSRYDQTSDILKNRARGYARSDDDNHYLNAPYLSMTQPYAAGSLLSTVQDLMIWTRALHSGKVLKSSTLNKAFTPHILPDGVNTYYGYGLVIGNMYGSPTVEHSGGIHGFVSNLVYLPQEEICIVLLSNCDCQPLGDLTEKIAAKVMGIKWPPDPVTVAAADLEVYTGVYKDDKNEERILTLENGSLFSKRRGSAKIKLQPYQKDRFFIDDSPVRITFTRAADNNAMVTGLLFSDRKSDQKKWIKVSNVIPQAPTAINLTTQQIQPLLGEYQLLPGLNITITNEGQRIFCQPSGQDRMEILATTPLRFMIKDDDAELEFSGDKDGSIHKLTLFQDGRQIPGLKIK